jgi:3-oxoacyl-(acyl-carrier-protein) synthase
VITGLGMVSPLGNDVPSSWRALLAGESGAAEITAFDHTDYNVHFACELKDFDPTVWVDRKAARRMDRFAQMILAAARQAERTRASTSQLRASGRRVDRDGHRRAAELPGLLRRPA